MNNELQALNHVATVEMTQGSFEIKGYDDLKQAIEKEVKKYDGLIIAYDDKKTIKAGKDSRAELNKVSKAIDDFRKQYKKQYNEPLAQFEAKMNELKSILDEAVIKIKKPLDEVEERAKEEKRKQVQTLIDELTDGYEIVFDNKWLNATTKDLDIRMAIIAQVDEAKEKARIREANVKMVRTFAEDLGQNPDAWVAMVDYESTADIYEKMKAAKQREEEKQKAYEELQKRNEETLAEVEQPVVVDEAEKTPNEEYAEFLFGEFMPQDEPQQDVEKTYSVTLTLTETQKEQLMSFCKLAEIKLNLEEHTQDEAKVIYSEDDLPW